MTLNKKMYINGELVDSKETFEVINPATAKSVGKIAWANQNDAKVALKAAESAAPIWANTSIKDRIEWMHKLREAIIKKEEHLRECIHFEMGKNWAGTQEDYDSMINSLQFYAEEILRVRPELIPDSDNTHTHQLLHEPVGVVVAYLAWNFPLLNLAFKIGPAMAAGCPIIIKPSWQSPISAYAIGEICAEINLPKGVVNIICGDDNEVGDALSSSPIPSLLTLIGSSRTGRHIMKAGATSIKRYSMELGGNAPVLIYEDADLDLAADIVCAVKFGNAGQICVTPNRVFVAASIYKDFEEKVITRAKAVKIGFDRHQDIDMGPLIDQTAWDRIDNLVQDAVAQGAKLLTGGERPKGTNLEQGSFYAPTVLSEVSSEMDIYKKEIFGPVVSLISFEDESKVIDQANDTDTGLTAYVFTRDLERSDRCVNQLRFGEIQINGVKYGINLPHCGIKQSGMGYDCSHLALHDYLAPKRVTRAIS